MDGTNETTIFGRSFAAVKEIFGENVGFVLGALGGRIIAT